MNIQPGKFYRLRNGCKAEIYSVGNPGLYSVHGRIFDEGEVTPDAWQSPGNYRYGGSESQFDIIAEWEEPAPKLVLWRHVGQDPESFHFGILALRVDGMPPPKEKDWERVDPKRILGVE